MGTGVGREERKGRSTKIFQKMIGKNLMSPEISKNLKSPQDINSWCKAPPTDKARIPWKGNTFIHVIHNMCHLIHMLDNLSLLFRDYGSHTTQLTSFEQVWERERTKYISSYISNNSCSFTMLPPKKTSLELSFLTLPEESCMFYILCIPAILSNVSHKSDWSLPATNRTLTLHYIYCGLKRENYTECTRVWKKILDWLMFDGSNLW